MKLKLPVVGVGVLLLLSCGGRSLDGPDGSPSGGAGKTATGQGAGSSGKTGSAGTTGSAGVTGAAGTTGAAGAIVGAAGAGAAGVTGAAGTTGSAGVTGQTGTAGVTGAAGTTGAAGATGAAGTTGAAGATGAAGTTGAAGATGAAGTNGACGPCPAATCKPGFMSVVDPAVSCCPICRPLDCATVSCAAVMCPTGQHAEVPDNQCCPVCKPGAESAACMKGRATYNDQRKGLIEKYNSQPCTKDDECTLIFESNLCVNNCGTALPVGLADAAKSNLDAWATSFCATCPMPPAPPCLPLKAVCSNGQCTALPGPTTN